MDDLDLLTTRCGADLGDPAGWIDPDCCSASMALCIIEAVQAPRSHYSSVCKVLDRCLEYRGERAQSDGAAELLATFEAVGGDAAWAERIGNRKPVATSPGSPLKASAIREAARTLVEIGLDTTALLRNADADVLERAGRAWAAVPGQRTGLTWSYLRMLAEVPSPLPDALVQRYVVQVVGRQLELDEVDKLVDVVAQRIGVTNARLCHAIWRFESKRPVSC